jgi:hypothetical protein
MQRQQRLTGQDPPRLWAVLDEAALRCPVGGPALMRGQLEHLIEMAKLPNVAIQTMPFRAGNHPAGVEAFTILRFPEADLPDVVCVESLTGARYLDKRDDVAVYTQAGSSAVIRVPW